MSEIDSKWAIFNLLERKIFKSVVSKKCAYKGNVVNKKFIQSMSSRTKEPNGLSLYIYFWSAILNYLWIY